jgi:phage gp29-like protein
LTVFDSRNEPGNLARGMSVDSVHSAIIAAEQGYVRDLFALYRDLLISDSHSQEELGKRKLAILAQSPSVAPYKVGDDPTPEDDANATFIRENIDKTSAMFAAYNHLLDSVLWPVAVVEKTFRVEGGRFRLASLTPVPHYLLDFSSGRLRITDIGPDGRLLTTSHEADPARYIVHRVHLLTTADNYGGPMRSILFWWLLSAQSREWWARFLDRFGGPFLLGKYDSGDDTSRTLMERAFKLSTRLGGLVVTRETEVEIMQAATAATGEAYERFINLCNDEKSKLIVGQTLSSAAKSTGMGSGVANLQAGVRDDIRAFDATSLGMTLRDQLFAQLLEINLMPGNAPVISFGQELSRDSVQASGAILQALFAAGLQVGDEGIASLSKQLGITLERRVTGSLPTLTALSVPPPQIDAINDVARAASAPLAQAFRGAFAPVRQIILSSRSADECSARIASYYADYPVARLTVLIEQALSAYAANGV